MKNWHRNWGTMARDNIIHLFDTKQIYLRNFIRLTVSNLEIKMQRIQSSHVVEQIKVGIDENSIIMRKLSKFKNWSIEVVIVSTSMSCMSSTHNSVAFNNYLQLSQYTQRATNTTFFNKMDDVMSVCDVYLNGKQNKFMNCIFSAKNPIVCMTVWPFWIVENYFEHFTEDRNLYDYAIFVVEGERYFETICYSLYDSIMLYRRDIVKSDTLYNKVIEMIMGALIYTQNITVNDIAVYILNKNLINSFCTQAARDMQIANYNNRKKISNY